MSWSRTWAGAHPPRADRIRAEHSRADGSPRQVRRMPVITVDAPISVENTGPIAIAPLNPLNDGAQSTVVISSSDAWRSCLNRMGAAKMIAPAGNVNAVSCTAPSCSASPSRCRRESIRPRGSVAVRAPHWRPRGTLPTGLTSDLRPHLIEMRILRRVAELPRRSSASVENAPDTASSWSSWAPCGAIDASSRNSRFHGPATSFTLPPAAWIASGCHRRVLAPLAGTPR